MEENINSENAIIKIKPVVEIEMIEITRPAVVEQIPKQEILDLIASDEKAIEEYTANIAVRQARIDQYQAVLDNNE